MSRMVKPIFSSISANDLGLNRFICVSPSVVDFSFNSNMSNPRPLGVVRHNIPPRGRSEYIFLTNATGLIRCSRSSKQPTRETSEKTVSSSISSIGFSMTSSPFSRQDSARQGEGSTTMQREKRFESLTSFAKTPDPAPSGLTVDDIFYQALRYRIEERYKSQIISCLPIFHKILCMLEHLVFPREKAWRMLCICCNRVHFQDGMMLWIAPTFRRLDRRKSQRSCVLWPAIRCRLSALLAVDPQENRGGCCPHWTLPKKYPSQCSTRKRFFTRRGWRQ